MRSGPRSGSTSSRSTAASRLIYRTVGNNSSFGGNSLVQSIGLLDATRVAELTVTWPVSRTTQTFRDLAADQSIEITEGTAAYKVPSPGAIAPPKRKDERMKDEVPESAFILSPFGTRPPPSSFYVSHPPPPGQDEDGTARPHDHSEVDAWVVALSR